MSDTFLERYVASRRVALVYERPSFSAIQAERSEREYEAAEMGSVPSVVRGELCARWVERPLEESASAAFRGTNEDDRARVPAPSIIADRVSRTMNESLARFAFSVSRRARTGVAVRRDAKVTGSGRAREHAGSLSAGYSRTGANNTVNGGKMQEKRSTRACYCNARIRACSELQLTEYSWENRSTNEENTGLVFSIDTLPKSRREFRMWE